MYSWATFSITTGYRGHWDCLSCIMFAVPSAGMSAFQAERGRKKQTGWVYEGVGEYLREEKLFQDPQHASVEVSLADPSHTGKSCCKGKWQTYFLIRFISSCVGKWPLLVRKNRMHIMQTVSYTCHTNTVWFH